MSPNQPAIAVTPSITNRHSVAQSRASGGVVLLSSPEELISYRDDCEQLADQALEPNLFFEHWMLQPAWEELGDERVKVLLIFNSTNSESQTLIGLFPVILRKGFRQVPIEFYTIWRHLHCPLCTPLLHRDHVEQALTSFFEWLGKQSKGVAIEFQHVGGDGPFWERFSQYLNTTGRGFIEQEQFERAFFRPGVDGASYLENALANKRRKELRRLWNRLSELGNLQVVELQAEDDITAWMREFTALEESGWKGRSGTAISMHEQEDRYFSRITAEAHARKRLMMLKLQLDDRPVAMKYNLLCEDGSYAAKIAFDEEFRQYSPGVQLEMQNVHLLHQRTDIRWMDSCAMPNHFMIERLWTERRVLRSCLVSTGKLTGNLVIRFFPTAEKFYRRYIRKETT